MKKYVLILAAIVFISSFAQVNAKTTSNTNLSSAIKMYKSGNYSQCYTTLSDIVKKDPSNAVAYYYLAMASAQIGKQDEAISNYEKVITLSPGGQLERYATKGKTCLESPDKCNESSQTTELDSFIQSKFGSGLSDEVRSDFEKQKIENFMREMNRKDSIDTKKFKDYKDFSSEVPSNDEIVTAIRVLQKAGLGSLVNNSDMSLISGNSQDDAMLNLLMNRNASGSSINPQVIQALLTNQLTTGF